MDNNIQQGDRDLVSLNYKSLLGAILKALQKKNLFRISKNGRQLFIDIDDIAYSVAIEQSNKLGGLLVGNYYNSKVATTNLLESSRDKFVEYNRDIRDCLQQHLESVVKENKYQSIEHYIKNLWTILSEFQIEEETKNEKAKQQSNKQKQKYNSNNQITLNYDFKKKYNELSKERLTFAHETGDIPTLKSHRLTITIKDSRNEFDLQLKQSLQNYIESKFSDSDNYDEIENIVEDLYKERNNNESPWYALKKLLNNDAIARVIRRAKIKYLEYLLEHISEHYHSVYLQILISRLQALENYINDPTKSDGEYQVSYASVSCNLREIFAQSYAFDSLPIIPLVDGGLGEVRDENKGELSFIFGLKLKLGGEIKKEDSKKVLDYNLGLVDPDSEKHKEGLEDDAGRKKFVEKVIRRAVLYYFVFAGNNPKDDNYKIKDDLEYTVIENFEEKILPVFKDSNESKKSNLLRGIIKGIIKYGADEKINRLKSLLTSQINKPKLWSSRPYTIYINVKQGILATDADKIHSHKDLFCTELKPKTDFKKYISVTDYIDTGSLCYLSGEIRFNEIGYFNTPDNQSFSMEYAIGKFPTIPIMVIPKEDRCRNIFKKNFETQKLILFTYERERLKQSIFKDDKLNEAFIYRFTFSLLSHICLKIILDTITNNIKRKVFIPILRLHLGNKQDALKEEVFMRSNFIALSHLINLNHRSSCQGICVKGVNPYKIRNALSSLYNILPKKFELKAQVVNPKIDKLAIVVVSSRECDRSSKGKYKKANLVGEVIKIDRGQDNSILVYTSKTISEHYDSNRLHSDPDALVREVDTLYENGYKHILYIAKAPYSQTLNLTDTEQDDNLYFMSSSVIHNLKRERAYFKIYPVFFDKYYVVKVENINRKSLYIQDAGELTKIVDDTTKKIAVFFNLFNGIQVGNDNYYNGVISYSTLLNIYNNPVYNDDISAGLINNDRDGLKNEILQLLTLFHFSRYEAAIGNIQLKLDPYENIIGDQSVGKLALFPHIKPNIEFNSLAFLNEVNDALDANLSSESEENTLP